MPQRTPFVNIIDENITISIVVESSVFWDIKKWILKNFPKTATSYYFSLLMDEDANSTSIIIRYTLPNYDCDRFIANLRLFCEQFGHAFNDKRDQ
jgi:hypothetical protein